MVRRITTISALLIILFIIFSASCPPQKPQLSRDDIYASGGIEILIKVGTKFYNEDLLFTDKLKGWVDGQLVSIRQAGYYNTKYCRMHFAVIECPNIPHKAVDADNYEFKKLLATTDINGKYEWDNGYDVNLKKARVRDRFIDFSWMLGYGYITEKQYNQIYNKEQNHDPIILDITDIETILKHEDENIRLNPSTLSIKGSVASGTYSIGSGLDYADLNTAEADVADTLTGNLTFEHNAEETTTTADVTFDTFVNGNLLKITAQSGDEHTGAVYGNGARVDFGNFDNLIFSESTAGHLANVEVSNLAFDATGLNENVQFPNCGDTQLLIHRLLVACSATSSYDALDAYSVGSGINTQIRNCIVYGGSNVSYGIGAYKISGGTIKVYNNTVVGFDNGIRMGEVDQTGTAECKNNLVQASGTADYSLTGNETTSKNISEDASGPDAAYDNTDVHTNSIFQDYSNDDYRLDSGGDATNLAIADDGDDLSGTFTDDIQGQTRSTWYIGASEIVAAAASSDNRVLQILDKPYIPNYEKDR